VVGACETSRALSTRLPSLAGWRSRPATSLCACSTIVLDGPDGRPAVGVKTDVESVEKRILARARHGTLHRALERASAYERDLVRLMLDQPALSYEEISAALRMPRDSIGPTRAADLYACECRRLVRLAGPGRRHPAERLRIARPRTD
jgi:hypothetical protein